MPDTTVADLKDTGVTVAPEAVVNEILPFCAQGQEGRDLLTQAEYAQDMQRNIGHQPGIARAQLANKQARQVSHMAAGLAQFLARRYAPGVLDDVDLDKVEAALVGALDAVIKSPAHLATLLRAGLTQPDGVTTTVDEDGLLSALGGNLLLNSEQWITESDTFTAPVDSLYDVLAIDGGPGGAVAPQNTSVQGGRSGAYKRAQVYLRAGQPLQITVGAGGIASTQFVSHEALAGGITTVGDIDFSRYERCYLSGDYAYFPSTLRGFASGGGFGGKKESEVTGWYGAGGWASSNQNGANPYAANGNPGVVCMRWHDPAKAAGPLPEPALLKAQRMAPRVTAAPVTVNLYDPATGQGSVWREEDAPAKLAEGLITEEAWLEICEAKAADDYAAWLVDPDTEAERFEMLRMACEAKLTATDKLTTPDYPIGDEDRAAVGAYRKAIRELNHQPGAPWDGGGEATPWPVEPVVTKVQEA